MEIQMLRSFTIFSIVIIYGRAAENVQFRPLHAYQCNKESCNQIFVNATESVEPPLYKSLELCQNVCSRYGGLWPRPKSVKIGKTFVKVHSDNIALTLGGKNKSLSNDCESTLMEMFEIAKANIIRECGGSQISANELKPRVVKINISIKKNSLALEWHMSEDYSLYVKTGDHEVTVTIEADNVYGARHGLETFTQLFAAEHSMESTENKICTLNLVSEASVNDSSEFTHRGLLLDTSRHFMPISAIKRTLDGMAASKFNVFHWHVTDSHSFPLQSPSVPEFTKYGAYSEEEIYTTEDVKDLIEYARLRGVRVVIEIDAPAHAGNGWQWGQEQGLGDMAVCVNQQPWRNYSVQPPSGQLNPTNQNTYKYLKMLYKDIIDMLPVPILFHMGGDEVKMSCWDSVEEIKSYVANYYNRDYYQLWSYFHNKTLSIWDEALKEKSKSEPKPQPVIIWSSHLTHPENIEKFLSKERYVIEVWEPRNNPMLEELLNKKYRAISVPKDIWYLDHGLWGRTNRSNWMAMYDHKLQKNDFLLGGEVAMWSEYVDDSSLDTQVWPRAAAVAERLWSDVERRTVDATERLERQRSRLKARGLRPEPIQPEWCRLHNQCS